MGLFVTGLEYDDEAELRRALDNVAEATSSVQYNEAFGVFMVQFAEETPELICLKNAVLTNSFACIISNARFVYTLRELDGLTYDEVKQMAKDDERQNLQRANYFVA